MLTKTELKMMRAPLKTCWYHGKPCYDKKTAQTARNQRWKHAHVALRIYACPHGNHFHLTSKNPHK